MDFRIDFDLDLLEKKGYAGGKSLFEDIAVFGNEGYKTRSLSINHFGQIIDYYGASAIKNWLVLAKVTRKKKKGLEFRSLSPLCEENSTAFKTWEAAVKKGFNDAAAASVKGEK